MKKYIYLIFLWFNVFATPHLWATGIDSLPLDKSAVTKRVPQKEIIDRYLTDDDFFYARPIAQRRNWIITFLEWLRDLIAEFLKKLGLKELETILTLSDVILYTLIGLVAVAIIYFIFKNEISMVWGRSKNVASQSINFSEVDLTEDTASLQKRLQQAITDKNYAEAIRLYYTSTLKNLSETGQISFRIDKTNNEYLFELPEGKLREPFKMLTYYFEYIVYGKFEATENAFLKTQEVYQQLYPNHKKPGAR